MKLALGPLIARAESRAALRSPLAVFGAGGKGARTIRFLASQGLTVDAVLDNNARPGQHCEGLAVERPADWARAHSPSEFEIVLAIHNPGVDLAALGKQVHALGFRRVVQPVELHQIFAPTLAPDYFLGPASRYRGKEESIARARATLADEASRHWFDRTLEFRLGGDYGVLPVPSPADQYRPADLQRWHAPMRLVDCGAYDGDSLRLLQAGGYEIEAYAAFEADASNFQRLQSSAGLPTEQRLLPFAVGATAGELRFAAGQGGASHLDAAGDVTVRCVRLDDVIADFRPTLIKMDVEGAEHDALLGAARLIAEHRPGLAISAYHRPEDLWRLALLVDGWRLGYRLYLRGHSHSSFDLVLYGVAA